MSCSELQCVAVCCSVLQCVAVCIAVCIAVCCSILQCITMCCSVLQVCCSVLQCVAVFVAVCCTCILSMPGARCTCSNPEIMHPTPAFDSATPVLRCVTVCYSVLQCVAMCCSCVANELQSAILRSCTLLRHLTLPPLCCSALQLC